MTELLEERRENWGTRGGFVLAAIGSAVGLGNLWAFPYKLYTYGGGAFLVPYIAAIFCIGVPMLILEFSLGHFTQRAAPDAFKRVNKKLEFVGWWGLILAFVIITYYPVILAYCFSYLWYSIEAIFNGGNLPWAGEGVAGVENSKKFFFETYLGHTEGAALGKIRLNLVLPLILTWLSMYLCIFKGVKLVGKIVWLTVPLPFFMLIVLTVRGLTLPGSVNGLVYYLDPVWSELSKPTTWRFAFGQVFFSLSLAFGVMVTYSSFLHSKSDLNNNAAIIGLSDFGTSFIAGLAIFSTLGGMAYVSSQTGNAIRVEDVVDRGPGLAFVAFPYALSQLPGAPWWSLIFFVTLVTLGVDSAFSITESVLAGIVDKTGWRRSVVLPIMTLVGFGSGLFYITGGGLNWLGTIDGFINGTWGIAFIGLLECIVLGWAYDVNRLRNHANNRSDWMLGRWWNYAVRVFIPLVLGTLFFWSLFDDLHTQGGFLATPEGQLNLFNCLGLGVVAVAPVMAVFMSIIKNPPRPGALTVQLEIEDRVHVLGRRKGTVAFTAAVMAAFLLIASLLNLGKMYGLNRHFLFASLGFATVALLLSNYVIEKSSGAIQRPSWLIRWSGIFGVLDLSGFAALMLINANQQTDGDIDHTKASMEHLSSTCYIILAVVFVILIFGLGWCFYRAITAGAAEPTPQYPENSEEK